MANVATVLVAIVAAAASGCGGGRNDEGSVGRASGFGTGGKVLTDFGGDDVAAAIAIQEDGKLLVAGGGGTEFALARYLLDGSLDRSFGTGGKVLTDVGAHATTEWEKLWYRGARDVAIQSDGKIIAVGVGGDFDFALVRYRRDGALDTSFGRGGKVVTDFGGEDAAASVAVQADGRVVVGGWSGFVFALARYTSNGQLDRSFGAGGKVLTGAGYDDYDRVSAVLVDVEGSIVAAGTSGPRFPGTLIARYTVDGALDSSFGRGGVVGGSVQASAAALQPDRRIVIVGTREIRGGDIDFGLARYTRAGRIDSTFGSRGEVITRFGARAWAFGDAVALQADGKIVAAGSAQGESATQLVLARYTRGGLLDGTFGAGGKLLTGVASRTGDTYAIAVQSDGKIIVAGASGRDFLLVRYNADGSLDS